MTVCPKLATREQLYEFTHWFGRMSLTDDLSQINCKFLKYMLYNMKHEIYILANPGVRLPFLQLSVNNVVPVL